MDKEVEKSLEIIFSNNEHVQNEFEQLKKSCEEPDIQISEQNTKELLLEQSEKQKENSQEKPAIEDFISNVNSDRALPDELAKTDGIPISKASAEGIHFNDYTDNNELISSENSEHALPNELAKNDDVPISNKNANQMHENEIEYCEPISTVNSKQFVGDLKQST